MECFGARESYRIQGSDKMHRRSLSTVADKREHQQQAVVADHGHVISGTHRSVSVQSEDAPAPTSHFSHRNNGYRRNAADKRPPLRIERTSTPPKYTGQGCFGRGNNMSRAGLAYYL